MSDPASPLVEILLTSGRAVGLQLNDKLSVRVVQNAPLLVEWRGHEEPLPATLQLLLEELLPVPQAREMLRQIEAEAAAAGDVALGTSVMRILPGGGPDRFMTLSLHRTADVPGRPLLLVMRDATAIGGLQQSLKRAQQSLDAALAVLRAPPHAIRLFLTGAMTTVGALRATMKLPARQQEAAHAKLTRLLEDADRLGADAATAGLETIARACTAFGQRAASLRDQTLVSGDEMLVLAPLLDQVASSVGDCLRIEEQRHIAPGRAEAAPTHASEQKEAREWARAAERRWSTLLRRYGERLGTLIKLNVQGARVVAPALRRDVDIMLQHLLRNAAEYGIETPEQRLEAGKPVTGEVSVIFEDMGRGLSLSVRDDGRGFDIERIGRAAVLSGLLSEESLVEYDPRKVVALIFKPDFSTENLEGEGGRGRGMSYLRRAVARLGGQINVATRPGAYTRMVIQLPADAVLAAEGRAEHAAAP